MFDCIRKVKRSTNISNERIKERPFSIETRYYICKNYNWVLVTGLGAIDFHRSILRIINGSTFGDIGKTAWFVYKRLTRYY